MNALVDGQDIRPFADGPIVRAVSVETVRIEFFKQYIANGDTPRKKDAARRAAFHRTIKDATAKGLICTREIGGVEFVWLGKPETAA